MDLRAHALGQWLAKGTLTPIGTGESKRVSVWSVCAAGRMYVIRVCLPTALPSPGLSSRWIGCGSVCGVYGLGLEMVTTFIPVNIVLTGQMNPILQ